jgi:hypothetical protein
MSDKLDYIRQAIAKGETRVNVVQIRKNSESGVLEKRAITTVNAQQALHFLSLPYNQRPHIYKSIQPLGFDSKGYAGSTGTFEKPDTNPLSLDALKEQALANPEVIQAILEAEKARKKAEKEAAKSSESTTESTD